MKILLIVVFCLLSFGHNCYSIPQNFGGNLFGATFLPQKIANDFTEKLIATSIWEDNDLPGQWKRIPSIDKDTILMLSVRPLIWGYHPTSVYANYEGKKIKSISIMYLDLSLIHI